MTQPLAPRGSRVIFHSQTKKLPKGRASWALRGQGWKLLHGISPWCSASDLGHVPRHQGAGAEMQQVDALSACIPPAPFLQAPDVCYLCCTISARSSPKKPFGGVWPLWFYPETGFQWYPLPFGPTSPTQPALCSSILFSLHFSKVSLSYSVARR